MMAAGVQDRNRLATEYLKLLRSLATELEMATHAISHNALAELEESLADQQVLSAKLSVLAGELSGPGEANPTTSPIRVDDRDLRKQILIATDVLQKLNRGYAALLQHSSRSAALMASLLGSFKGQFQEASGPRSKYQTWSCQM
ncbi:MAG TPA: hypothetical protein VIJ38_00675 [Acidobacteriaceae bacterium]